MAGTGLSTFMTAPWQLFLTWGLMVGIGSGAGAVGMAAAIANRWFARRTGFAMGLLTAANAAGQLIFLPLLAMLAERYGWRSVAICVTLAVAVVLPIVALLLPESPGRIGLGPYGSTAIQQPGSDHAAGGNPFAVAINALARGSRSLDFWLLCVTFGICGFSTNGLINTHLIAYCADHGIAEVNGASILAVIGVFSLIGSAASGWMCDRFNPRVLLFWYYGLRGLSLVMVPFTSFDAVSLSVFAVFYGLDWVATGPATFALTNEIFGRRDTPVIVSWIFAGAPGRRCAGRIRRRRGAQFRGQLSARVRGQRTGLPAGVDAGPAGQPAGTRRWRRRNEGGLMDLHLADKVVLITGSSRGIGLATAKAFAAEGCRLVLSARSADALRDAEAALRASGAGVASQVADVTQPADAARLVQAAVTAFGGIDILVNNVGGSVGGRGIADSTDEDWRAALEMNLLQTVRMMRLALPHMSGRPGAAVVNVSSISGWSPQLVGSGQYGAAKAALIFDAERWALEFVPHGVRVNTVSPGSILVDGNGWDRYRIANQANYDDYVRHGFPMGRLGTAEEVADVIVFLASPRAHWINGRNVPVDGLEQPYAARDRRPY